MTVVRGLSASQLYSAWSFSWSEESRRYRDLKTGRYLPGSTIRNAVDVVVSGTGDYLRDLTSQLRDGSISIPQWQQAMQQEIKSLHLATAAASRGGWAAMSQSDFGWTGQRLRGQYAYLRGFATDIASGAQPLNGTLEARAALYAEAARTTAREMEYRMAVDAGAGSEINRLGVADHCSDCVSASARGWVEVGTLSPPGTRQCKSRCHCRIQTRAAPAA